MAGDWEKTLLDKGLQCPICIEFFNAPLTLSCKHTFCRLCLLQSTRLAPDGRRCPECRATIDIKDPLRHLTNAGLEQQIREIVPKEILQARMDTDVKQLETIVADEKCKLPVFFMRGIASKPGQAVGLHFFEPRYKVLIRRTWEGNHRFLCTNSSPREGDTGLEVQVEQASFQADGTADIKGFGVKLVTLGRVWVEDGTDGLFYADVTADVKGAQVATPRRSTTSSPDEMSDRRVKEVLAEAIGEGAPAYNRGQIVVCARLYLDVAQELLRSNVNGDTAAVLQRAVQQAETAGRDHNKAAWALRHAFDEILESRPRSSGSSSSSHGPAHDVSTGILAQQQEFPMFYMNSTQRAAQNLSINLRLFEPRYRILAREAWESPNKCFLYASSGFRQGDRAMLVRINRCTFESSGEASINGTSIAVVSLGDTRQDSSKEGLFYAKCSVPEHSNRIKNATKAGQAACCVMQ